MNRRQRRMARLERMEGQRRNVRHYPPAELRSMLVEDAVNGYGPASQPNGFENGLAYLDWMIAAITRIAEAEHKKVDPVFCEIRDEVKARGREMPL